MGRGGCEGNVAKRKGETTFMQYPDRRVEVQRAESTRTAAGANSGYNGFVLNHDKNNNNNNNNNAAGYIIYKEECSKAVWQHYVIE